MNLFRKSGGYNNYELIQADKNNSQCDNDRASKKSV